MTRSILAAAALSLSFLAAQGVLAQSDPATPGSSAPYPGTTQPSTIAVPSSPNTPPPSPGSQTPAVQPETPAAPAPVGMAPRHYITDDRPLPAYKLNLPVDFAILGTAGAVAATRLFASKHADCAPLCNKQDVNPIDRISAGFYDTKWQNVADVGLYSVLAGTAVAVFADEGWSRGINDATVVTESILSAAAMSSILTLAAGRPRPYMYSDIASVPARSGPDGTMSFLSGHAAACFAAGTSLFITEHRLHPDSDGPWVGLGLTSAAATFVAVARVMGGNHFISDNVIGAAAGISMGIIFPSMHDQPVHVTPLVSDTQKGFAMAAAF